MIVFDIETGPLDAEKLRERMPAFDETEVKVGNLKDPDKIAAKIAEAKAAHEEEFTSRAALSALTGQVLAIGYHSLENAKTLIDHGPEQSLLRNFWARYEKCRAERRRLIGHNILGFDVPFIMRRSWLLDVTVPATVLDKGKWLDANTFSDTMAWWSAGGKEWVKLDALAKAFDAGEKPEGIGGADFARLWNGTPAEREQALAYLQNDLQMTAKVAVKMGLS